MLRTGPWCEQGSRWSSQMQPGTGRAHPTHAPAHTCMAVHSSSDPGKVPKICWEKKGRCSTFLHQSILSLSGSVTIQLDELGPITPLGKTLDPGGSRTCPASWDSRVLGGTRPWVGPGSPSRSGSSHTSTAAAGHRAGGGGRALGNSLSLAAS